MYMEDKGPYQSIHLELTQQLAALEVKLSDELALKEQLELELASGDDPAWIELMLMKHLGLTPKGAIKVIFSEPRSNLDF